MEEQQILTRLLTAYYRDTLGLPNWKERVERRSTNGLRALSNRLTKFVPLKGKKVLDIGCGYGDFVYELEASDQAKLIVGIEPDNEWASLARKRTNYEKVLVNIAVGENLPFKNGEFDIVFCNQVVEHVQDLNKFISEMVRVCAPDGWIYLTGPNYLIPLEYHYQVWLLPWLPKSISAWWLHKLGRNPDYLLSCITFVNPFQVIKSLRQAGINSEENVMCKILRNPELIASERLRKIGNYIKWISLPTWVVYLILPTFEILIHKPIVEKH